MNNYTGVMDVQQRQLSVDEMHDILMETIPIRERMDAVYMPILAQDCACYLCEDLVRLLAEIRFSQTKKQCRELKECIENYRYGNKRAMLPVLFEDISNKSREIYNWIGMDMYIHVLQYSQEVLKYPVELAPEVTKAVSEAYVVRKILRYVMQLDRNFSKAISEKLPIDVVYKTDDNEYCVQMDKLLTDMIKIVGTPDELDSVNIQLSYEIFKNKISQYHIGYGFKELSNHEKRKYSEGFCRCGDCDWYHTIKEGVCRKSGKSIDTNLKKVCWRRCEKFKA